MRFFSIRRLKGDLARGPLTARATAQYLAAQGALLSVLYVPSPAHASADWGFIVHPLLALAGVYYCYRRNGGPAGERLAERYLAVGWVVGIRVASAAIALLVLTVTALALTSDVSEWTESRWLGVGIDLGTVALVAFIYWRMGVHLADIRRQVEPASASG